MNKKTSPIEFCWPDDWSEAKKERFTHAMEQKIADSLAPLADKILEDNKKDTKEGE